MSEARKTLAEALCTAQAQMSNPKKDKTATVKTRTGGTYTYNYTTLDAVLDVVRPVLNANGVFLSQFSERLDGETLLLHTRVMHGEEVQELDCTPYQYDNDPQEFGKRETYARRYSLLKAFGLAGDDDTDGDTGAGATTANRQHQANRRPSSASDAQSAPQLTPEERRRMMLVKCAELSAKCVENGVNAGATESYMVATFNVESMDQLDDGQLIEFGKYLREMEKQSRGLNERS